MLTVLGLGAAEEIVYRQLVSCARATAADLAAATGQPVEAVSGTLDRLVERGLAVADPAGTVAAAPPAVALGALVRQVGDDLREAERELARLADEHRAATVSLPEGGLAEVITDVAAVRHRFAQIQDAARYEIRSMMVPDLAVVPVGANSAGDSCLRRGLRYRAIVDRAALARPGVVQEALVSLDDGEDIRVAEHVPVKMIIADDTCAMVPLLRGQNTAAASVLIHPSGTLDALIAYFEMAWSHAYPLKADPAAGTVTEVGPAEPDALDRQILALLLAGLTDDTVANQLGTSLRTVQRRIRQMSVAAGAKTRIQLGWHAARRGWA